MSLIVVVGPRCWGCAATEAIALRRARDVYSDQSHERKLMPYNVYRASEDFSVDEFGTIEAQKLEKIREVRPEVQTS